MNFNVWQLVTGKHKQATGKYKTSWEGLFDLSLQLLGKDYLIHIFLRVKVNLFQTYPVQTGNKMIQNIQVGNVLLVRIDSGVGDGIIKASVVNPTYPDQSPFRRSKKLCNLT